MSMNEPRLLTDEQMRQFITEGYLLLQTDFSSEFHQQLLEQLNYVYSHEGNPGNNLLPRVRELQKVIDHPIITGALTSVLGPDYMLHAHHHGHFNNSPQPGGWHKDSYFGYGRIRNHHPWWAMIMYFPQDTPVELGPTGVMPGTQNYATRVFEQDESESEAKASGGAGTFALIAYDIWHRSTANILGKERYMLKFEFMRTQSPTVPSWDHQQPEWVTPAAFSAPIHPHECIWQETWNWMRGEVGSSASAAASQVGEVSSLLEQLNSSSNEERVTAADQLGLLRSNSSADEVVTALAKALEDAYEPVALNAGYALARYGDHGIQALLEGLRHEDRIVSLSAAYGLSVAGAGAVEGLTEALDSEREETVTRAVFALGELRELASDSVPLLIGQLSHPSSNVRISVVEALGNIGQPHDIIVQALARCLKDSDTQVRFMTGLSLAKLGKSAEEAVPSLIEALDDENRYVRAHAAEALYYIGTEKAERALIHFLKIARWCPSTTPASTFYP
ncbi:HEAT repeat domain-containing protein [Paenibacillus terrigena]|uniref:HEAT repeat domain-containing protein n=1 Tax=Paenibacillus terrigena TaxID=369333 RepID=UPI0028D39DED|nr:HEAT repeat domain-containing protein [Paenibacillus terrigena]